MEFLKKLPNTAVISPDSGQFSFPDRATGNLRNGYRINIIELGSETSICNINGDLLERIMNPDGTLDRAKAIQFLPEARRLFSRHSNSKKISFSSTFKQAHYQFEESAGKAEKQYKVVVLDDKGHSSKTFTGSDRKETLDKAVTWMETEQFEDGTLQLYASTKSPMQRVLVTKDRYEGRRNLSNVEVELHLEYLTKVDGWLVLPEGT